MRIGITGASGAVGSWLSHVLSEKHEVFAYIRESSDDIRLSKNSKLRIERSTPAITWNDLIERDKPEILILSDWVGVSGDFRNSISQETNVVRQMKTISRVSKFGVRTIVGIGSQAELGPLRSTAFENLQFNPQTEYAKKKIEAFKALSQSCHEQGITFYWARLFSAYGMMDSESWFIPSLISALSKNHKFQMTDGSQVWSYLNFIDIAKAIEHVIGSDFSSRIVNIGNEKTNTIREIAQLVGERMDSNELIDFDSIKVRKDQTFFMKPDCATLNSLGWKPAIDIEEGIDDIIKWRKSSGTFTKKISDDFEITIPGYSEYAKT
jgi:nucleoside-diphosphate-sugar epimerase